MAAARQVQIEVTGKVDQYESALKQAESKTREMARNIGDASSIDGPTQRYTDFLGINSYDRTKGQRRAAAEASRRDAVEEARKTNEAIAREAETATSRRVLSMGTGGTRDMASSMAGRAFNVSEWEEILKKALLVKMMEGALKSATAMVTVFTGTTQEKFEAIGRIPVLGGFLRECMALGEALSGVNKKLEEQNKLHEEGMRLFNQRVAEAKRLDAVESARTERIKNLDREYGQLVANKIDKTGRRAELQATRDEESDRLTGLTIGSREYWQVMENAAMKRKEINLRYDKQEMEEIERLKTQRRVAEFNYAGDNVKAEKEQIKARYEADIRNATSDKAKGLLMGAMNYELARVDGEENKKRMDERKEKVEAYFDKWASARDKAKSKLESNVDIIAGQRLEASDAGMLTRGTGTDRTQEIAAEQAKLQEETNKILSEMLQRERAKGAFTAQMVGFN